MATFTFKFESPVVDKMRDVLLARGFEFRDTPYAHFQARIPTANVTYYESGKVVVQGKEAELYAALVAPRALLEDGQSRFDGALAKLPGEPVVWIGSDESGKGDYFGPLVVCAALARRDQLDLLDELGAADCKTLSDKKIRELAPLLEAAAPHAYVAIGPASYNRLYDKCGRNLNKLLAWAHARALENLLLEHPEATVMVVDRFAKGPRVENALMEEAQKRELVQRPRAEDDPAVAVASILARNRFMAGLYGLGKRFNIKLAKGAGPPVLAAGRKFLATHGRDQLGDVAKLHFKTTLNL